MLPIDRDNSNSARGRLLNGLKMSTSFSNLEIRHRTLNLQEFPYLVAEAQPGAVAQVVALSSIVKSLSSSRLLNTNSPSSKLSFTCAVFLGPELFKGYDSGGGL